MTRITVITACAVVFSAASVDAQNKIFSTTKKQSSMPSAVREAWPGQAPQSDVRTIRPVADLQTRQLVNRQIDPGEQQLPLGPYIEELDAPIRVRDYSRIYIEAVKPAEIKVHDIVTIVVDEKSEVIMNQRFNRQKNAKLKAELKDFVRLGETGNLANAAANAPAIDSQLQSNLLASGTLTDQEGIKYRIAAKVKDVKPNGTITLEARKEIQTQDDASEYLLTGEIRSQDIKPDNTASSEDIANLSIIKRAKGRVYDSSKRGWGVRLLDLLSPF